MYGPPCSLLAGLIFRFQRALSQLDLARLFQRYPATPDSSRPCLNIGACSESWSVRRQIVFLSSLLFLSASPPSPPIWNCRLFRELGAGQESAQTCRTHQRQETLRDRRRSDTERASLPSGASSVNNCSIGFKSASFSRRFNSEGVFSASVAGWKKKKADLQNEPLEFHLFPQ